MTFLLETIPRERQVQEWWPIPLWSTQFIHYKILALLFVASLFSPARKRPWELAIIAFSVFYGFKHQRHSVLAVIVMAPMAAACFAQLLESWTASHKSRAWPRWVHVGVLVSMGLFAGFQLSHNFLKWQRHGFQISRRPGYQPGIRGPVSSRERGERQHSDHFGLGGICDLEIAGVKSIRGWPLLDGIPTGFHYSEYDFSGRLGGMEVLSGPLSARDHFNGYGKPSLGIPRGMGQNLSGSQCADFCTQDRSPTAGSPEIYRPYAGIQQQPSLAGVPLTHRLRRADPGSPIVTDHALVPVTLQSLLAMAGALPVL